MSIRPVLESQATAITVTGLPTLGAGLKVLSEELSLATLNTVGLSIDVSVSIDTPQTGEVNVYIVGSNTSTEYGSVDGITNTILIGSVDLTETTPKVNIIINKIPPFFKLMFMNTALGALSGTATVTRTSLTVDNV